MAENSKIEWTDATWNPIVGCSVTSPGCTNCYAMTMAARLERMGSERYTGLTKPSKAGPVWTGVLRQAPEATLLQPLRWRQPRRIFVNSMSDLFHEDVPDEWIDQVFAVMALAPQHTFQVLTKRAARMRAYLSAARAHPVGLAALDLTRACHARDADSAIGSGIMLQGDIAHLKVWPLPNVWLGVSVEDQPRANERIPHLLATPAAKRFLSCEPLLGLVELRRLGNDSALGQFKLNALDGLTYVAGGAYRDIPPIPSLDWIIVGGESGSGPRPMHPDWARSLRDQCQAANVPFFFKQWGGWAPSEKPSHWISRTTGDARPIGQGVWLSEAGMARVDKKTAGAMLDGREWREMPA